MDIQSLYQDVVETGQQSCRRGDSQRGAKIHQYRVAKQKLFEALKNDYYVRVTKQSSYSKKMNVYLKNFCDAG